MRLAHVAVFANALEAARTNGDTAGGQVCYAHIAASSAREGAKMEEMMIRCSVMTMSIAVGASFSLLPR